MRALILTSLADVNLERAAEFVSQLPVPRTGRPDSRLQPSENASAAFAERPRGPSPSFSPSTTGRCRPRRRSCPSGRPSHFILNRKEGSSMATNVSTPKGTAIFSSRQDRELFDIMHVVKAPDAKRAYLRSAVERFPRGLESMRSGEDDPNSMSISDGGPRDPKQDAEECTRAIAPTRVAEALTALREDPKRPCRW